MNKKKETLAGRLTRKLMIWLCVIVIAISYFVIHITNWVTREYYSESYHSRTLIDMEYTRRVLSDVYVAVTNNIYYLEQNLDDPNHHKEVMKRIVSNGTRIRSCGISFIEDYYYPEKGHRFCPYAWRNAKDTEKIETIDMDDSALDYLHADWFQNAVNADSGYWSKPFFGGYEEKKTLTAYMAPIHDKTGRVVAILGADVSLDWLTQKLVERDSIINTNATFASKILKEKSQSFIINQDGMFITHPDEARIMKDNFFNHIEEYDNADLEGLVGKMKNGTASEQEKNEKYRFEGQKCYVYYTPVKYTNWMMVTVVPCQSIDMLGILYGIGLLLFIAILMIVIVVVCHYFMKNATVPLQQLATAASNIAKGKYDTQLPETKHHDEIRQMCDALEHMQYEVSERLSRSTNDGKH